MNALLSSFGFLFNIVMLCETWYRNEEVLQMSDYVSHYLNQCNKEGGGVLLLTRTNLHSNDFEILAVLYHHSISSIALWEGMWLVSLSTSTICYDGVMVTPTVSFGWRYKY